MVRLCYVELPASRFDASRAFYADAFGLSLTGFGPSYAATLGSGTDLGLQGDAAEATAAPLAIFEVDDLEAAVDAVERAGGVVTKPIFAFPGGRRFHFRDPSGNELAALKGD